MKPRSTLQPGLVVCIACLILSLSQAALPCDIRVSFAENAQLSPARSFGLSSSTSLISPVRIELISQQPACTAIIGFASRSGTIGNRYMTSGTEQIAYRLLSRPSGSQELADLPGAQDDAVLRGIVNARQTTVFQYYLMVPGNQAASPGTYRDRIEISVYTETNGSPQLTAAHTVDVALTVRPEVKLQMQSGGGLGSGPDVHVVDFGELQTGEQAELRMQVNANVAFAITVSSENGGELRHVSEPQAVIPYTVQVGGSTPADWRRPVTLVGLPTSGSRVSFFPLVITVGSVEYSLAGLYRDRLLVTIQAQ